MNLKTALLSQQIMAWSTHSFFAVWENPCESSEGRLISVNGKVNGDTWWWTCALTAHYPFRSPNTGASALHRRKGGERASPRLHVSGLHQVHQWGGEMKSSLCFNHPTGWQNNKQRKVLQDCSNQCCFCFVNHWEALAFIIIIIIIIISGIQLFLPWAI